MAKDKQEQILAGITKLNTKLETMSKINDRVIVLEERGKQVTIDIQENKDNLYDHVKGHASKWNQVFNGVILLIATISAAWVIAQMNFGI